MAFIRGKFEELRHRVVARDIRDVGGFLHKELFEAGGNKSPQRLMALSVAQVHWFQSMAAHIQGREERAIWEGDGSLSALEAGDPVWAENVARAPVLSLAMPVAAWTPAPTSRRHEVVPCDFVIS